MVHVASTREFRDEEERWEEFVERLQRGVHTRKVSDQTLCQYDKPRSYLKRETYRYVLERFEDGRSRQLQRCIERAREGFVPAIPSFEQNPFHWTLLGVQRNEGLELGSDDVSRFGRQLAYAAKHNVPPQLLIGFLAQTGSPGLISRKWDSGEVEEWHATLPAPRVVRL